MVPPVFPRNFDAFSNVARNSHSGRGRKMSQKKREKKTKTE